jgi:hypothetical protein
MQEILAGLSTANFELLVAAIVEEFNAYHATIELKREKH